MVSAATRTSTQAKLRLYAKKNGLWSLYAGPYDCVLGRNGLDKQKEGDGRSPTGIYSLGTAFGTVSWPSGVAWPYRQTTSQDYWVDDVKSTDYNKWIRYSGDPYSRWQSFERLNISQYKYALVINYNLPTIVVGRGSAIFLHVWKGSGTSTSGCTALAADKVLAIQRWLDPAKNPVLLQGTTAYINSLATPVN
jgi:L,D-peptidoglycan transpeptidase YkuD (ErfK/YbiS/YcfS/YnhG family)